MPSLSVPDPQGSILPNAGLLNTIYEEINTPEGTFLTSLPTQPSDETHLSNIINDYNINIGTQNDRIQGKPTDVTEWHQMPANPAQNEIPQDASYPQYFSETAVNVLTPSQPHPASLSVTPRAVYQLPARPIWRKTNCKLEFYNDPNFLKTLTEKVIEPTKKQSNVQFFQENCTNSALPSNRKKIANTNNTPYRNNHGIYNSHPGTPFFSRRSASNYDNGSSLQMRTGITKTSVPPGNYLSSSIIQIPLSPAEPEPGHFKPGDASFLQFSGKVCERSDSKDDAAKSGMFISVPTSTHSNSQDIQHSKCPVTQNDLGSIRGSSINLNQRSQNGSQIKYLTASEPRTVLTTEIRQTPERFVPNYELIAHAQQSNYKCNDLSKTENHIHKTDVYLPAVEQLPELMKNGNRFILPNGSQHEHLTNGAASPSDSKQNSVDFETKSENNHIHLSAEHIKILDDAPKQKLSRQEASQILKWHFKHLFQMNINGAKYVLWSDVQDIMFPNCKPDCRITLTAIQEFFNYPEKTDSLLECTKELCKKFLKYYYCIHPGSFLINVISLASCNMTLWNLVKRKHSESENECWACTYLNRGSKSDTVLCGKSHDNGAVNHTLNGENSTAYNRIIRTNSDEMIQSSRETSKTCEPAKPVHVLSTLWLPTNSGHYNQYYPLNEVVQAFPSIGISRNFQQLCSTVDINKTNEFSDGDAVICCPKKYAKSIGRCIVSRNGWGGNWMHVTPNSMLIRNDVASTMINEAVGNSSADQGKTVSKKCFDGPMKVRIQKERNSGLSIEKKSSAVKHFETTFSDCNHKKISSQKVTPMELSNKVVMLTENNSNNKEDRLKSSKFHINDKSSRSAHLYKPQPVEKATEYRLNNQVNSRDVCLSKPNSVVRAIRQETHGNSSAIIGKSLCSTNLDECGEGKTHVYDCQNKNVTKPPSLTSMFNGNDKQKSSEEALIILRQSRSLIQSKDDLNAKAQPKQIVRTCISNENTTSDLIQSTQPTSESRKTSSTSSDSETYQSNIKVVIKKVKKKKSRTSKSNSRQEILHPKTSRNVTVPGDRKKQHSKESEVKNCEQHSDEKLRSQVLQSKEPVKDYIKENNCSTDIQNKSMEHKQKQSTTDKSLMSEHHNSSRSKPIKQSPQKKKYFFRKSKSNEKTNIDTQRVVKQSAGSPGRTNRTNTASSLNSTYTPEKSRDMKKSTKNGGSKVHHKSNSHSRTVDHFSTSITDDFFKKKTVEELPKYSTLKSEVVSCFMKEMSEMTDSLKNTFYKTYATKYANKNDQSINNSSSDVIKNFLTESNGKIANSEIKKDFKKSNSEIKFGKEAKCQVKKKTSNKKVAKKKKNVKLTEAVTVNSSKDDHSRNKTSGQNKVQTTTSTLIENISNEDVNDTNSGDSKHDFNISNNVLCSAGDANILTTVTSVNSSPEFHTVLSPCREIEQYGTRVTTCQSIQPGLSRNEQENVVAALNNVDSSLPVPSKESCKSLAIADNTMQPDFYIEEKGQSKYQKENNLSKHEEQKLCEVSNMDTLTQTEDSSAPVCCRFSPLNKFEVNDKCVKKRNNCKDTVGMKSKQDESTATKTKHTGTKLSKRNNSSLDETVDANMSIMSGKDDEAECFVFENLHGTPKNEMHCVSGSFHNDNDENLLPVTGFSEDNSSASKGYNGKKTDSTAVVDNPTIQVIIDNCGQISEYEAVPQFSIPDTIHSDDGSVTSLPSYSSMFAVDKNNTKPSTSHQIDQSLMTEKKYFRHLKNKSQPTSEYTSDLMEKYSEYVVDSYKSKGHTNQTDRCVQVDFEENRDYSLKNVQDRALSTSNVRTLPSRKCRSTPNKRSKRLQEKVNKQLQCKNACNITDQSTTETVRALSRLNSQQLTRQRAKSFSDCKNSAEKHNQKILNRFQSAVESTIGVGAVKDVGIQCNLKNEYRYGYKQILQHLSQKRLLSRHKITRDSKNVHTPLVIQTSEYSANTQTVEETNLKCDLGEKPVYSSLYCSGPDNLPQLNMPRKRRDSKTIFTFPVDNDLSDNNSFNLTEYHSQENVVINSKICDGVTSMADTDVNKNSNPNNVINSSSTLEDTSAVIQKPGNKSHNKPRSPLFAISKFMYSHRKNDPSRIFKTDELLNCDNRRRLHSKDNLNGSYLEETSLPVQNSVQYVNDADNESGISDEDILFIGGDVSGSVLSSILRPILTPQEFITSEKKAKASNAKMKSDKEKKKKKLKRKVYSMSSTDSDDSDEMVREADEKWKLAAFHREQLRVFELCRKMQNRRDEELEGRRAEVPEVSAHSSSYVMGEEDQSCTPNQSQIEIKYDEIIDSENTVSNRGFVNYDEYCFPYIIMNGYKFMTINDAVSLFPHCRKDCRIPRSLLQKHKGLQRTLCTWEQVYLFELTGPNERKISTGTVLIRVDTLLKSLSRLRFEVKEKHRNTPLKKSKHCQYALMPETTK